MNKDTQSQLGMFDENNSAPLQTKAVNISMSKTINAPLQKVFDYWLIPVFVGNWIFATKINPQELGKMDNEVRVGGTFNYSASSNGRHYEFSGEFSTVDIPKRLVFTWKESPKATTTSRVSVSFIDEGERSKIKLSISTQLPAGQDARDVKQNWAKRCGFLAAVFDK
ncbi:MAG: hypothetical protein COC19_08490 [SAR86 cluster bacterium]|uniref:Activator of Hsp90 ATPase homologue 1/2-like C-terminal domain-containing protein n=1 Tax=SAR86 cluster bacterium TaxID=2030880 RepID=A0A2A4MEI2_9GAMM|nr:MAG: hypothetical protein COC19_08490 [SAR86 cluster bacterium]